MVGYRVPNYMSNDSYALTILESILSHGKSSRLYRSLVYDQKIALAVGTEYNLLQTDPELLYCFAVVKPGSQIQDVEQALYREFERIQESPPSEQELQRAKNQVEAEYLFGQDSNFRQAMVIGQAETVGAGWRHIDKFLERIRGVTSQDVQRVARQYLTAETRTVGTLIPLPPSNESAAASERQ